MWNPLKDGIDHINIYSKGKTVIGRKLTNFAKHPFTCEDGDFKSIEGYWYWLSCKDDRLRKLSGFEAKKLGRELRAADWVKDEWFKEKILKAIQIKLDDLRSELKGITLPFAHYYVYGYGDKAKVNEPEDGKWIIDFIQNYVNRLNDVES